MLTRHAILAKPCWQPEAQNPTLRSMPLEELAALDRLVALMGQHGRAALSKGDCRAWARLSGGKDWLDRTARGVLALEGPEAPDLRALRDAANEFEALRGYKAISRAPQRTYRRVKSVPEAELPPDWKRRLSDIDARSADGAISMADDLFVRMKRKMCEYCRYVRAEQLEDDLTFDGLRGFFTYETTRISIRGAPLRPATIANTFGDLRKFMQLSGTYPSERVDELGKLLEKLRDRAEVVTAGKYAALSRIDVKTILPEANATLDGVGKRRNPAQRHVRRNRALALALPPMTPLRREWHELRLGRDLVWSEGRHRFRDYKLRKTRHHAGRESYPGSVHPSVAHFVDAVLLPDDAPKYLEALRHQAEQDHWPLFVHPDGLPVAPNYVSQVWASKLGTGAHIARTIVYDILFALGEDAARGGLVLNDHRSRQSAARYIGNQAKAAALAAASRERDDIAELYGFSDG